MKENSLINYFKDSLRELNKVSWPTKNQAIKLTFLVLGFIFSMAIVLGIFDFIFNTGYRELIKLRPAQPIEADSAPIEIDPSDFEVTDTEGNPIPIEISTDAEGSTVATEGEETETVPAEQSPE